MIYPDYRAKLTAAADRLAEQFPNLNWNFRPVPEGGRTELISQWLGDASEDIMVVTFKGKRTSRSSTSRTSSSSTSSCRTATTC